MATIKPVEVHVNNEHYDWRKPYACEIGGKLLRTHDHRLRLFRTQEAACSAGIDEVNAERASSQLTDRP